MRRQYAQYTLVGMSDLRLPRDAGGRLMVNATPIVASPLTRRRPGTGKRGASPASHRPAFGLAEPSELVGEGHLERLPRGDQHA